MRAAAVLCVMFVSCSFWSVRADTPGNCTYEEIEGLWTFSVGSIYRSYVDLVASEGDCSNFQSVKSVNLNLRYPDIATDELGNVGFWTLIYNQGFEVVINNRKYFAFSRYEGTMEQPVSICNETMPGLTHDVLQRQWACYKGARVGSSATAHEPRLQYAPERASRSPVLGDLFHKQRRYIHNPGFVRAINSVQNNWRAERYPEYEGMTLHQLSQRTGGPASKVRRHRAAPVSLELKTIAAALPESFDWRNIDGRSFVSPVRNQAQCGSCYSFAAAAMLETRIRIASDNKLTPVLSPQDVVECSPYSQGCSGGFPYLIGGKYAEDFGFVEESCNPYRGEDGPCSTAKNCTRYYGTNYRYVGGYYGACNEEVMKLALLHEGPLAVGFEVYDDFMSYRSGVYTHTGLLDKFNPFELTNHAVLLVGYGVDEQTGMKFWSVKNSWGTSWGEGGYFRIRRGSDECGMESLAVTAQAVL